MEVELITADMSDGFSPKMEETGVQEAASEELQSMETLITMLSLQQQKYHTPPMKTEEAEEEFNKKISHLGHTRTGHARFRRAPLPSLQQNGESCNGHKTIVSQKNSDFSPWVYCPTPIQRLPPSISPHHHHLNGISMNGGRELAERTTSSPLPATNSFLISSLTGDTDHTKLASSSSLKRKCCWKSVDGSDKCGTVSGRCHCSKRRRLKVKRVVRVPAISSKMADIPSDEFSWRKYGQKPIKGSPHPRIIREQRLDGIIMFADDSNIHSRELFDEIQSVNWIGAISMGILAHSGLSQSSKFSKDMSVPVQGPACDLNGQLVGWHTVNSLPNADNATYMDDKGTVLPKKLEWAGVVLNSRLVWKEAEGKPEWVRDLELLGQNVDELDSPLYLLNDSSFIEPLGKCGQRILMWWLRAEARADSTFPSRWIIDPPLEITVSANSTEWHDARPENAEKHPRKAKNTRPRHSSHKRKNESKFRGMSF